MLLTVGVVPVAMWNFVPLPLPDTVLGVAVAWLGLVLFRRRATEGGNPV